MMSFYICATMCLLAKLRAQTSKSVLIEYIYSLFILNVDKMFNELKKSIS